MNSLKTYFSPTKMNPPPVPEPPPERIEIIAETDTNKPKSDSKVASSRQIVSNMESVINSVKKKHRHRKKKDAVNTSEPEITDISNILTNSLNFVSPDVTLDAEVEDKKSQLKENLGNKKTKKRSRTLRKAVKNSSTSTTPSSSQASTSTPSSSQASASTTDSGITLLSPTKNGSIRDHFSPKNKAPPPATITNDDKSDTAEKPNPKMNAFTLMMSARNRSIGSNTLGKENPNGDITASLDPVKVKRKLMLEEWADRKGGAKRKIEEVQREEYIEHALDKRAKRFKKMLAGDDNSPKPPAKKRGRPRKIPLPEEPRTTLQESVTALEEAVIVDPVPSSQQKSETEIESPAGTRLKRLRQIKTPKEPTTPKAEDQPIRTDSLSKPKVAPRKRNRRLSSAESNQNVSNSQDLNFIEKLSSPIKKRDSLLGYFPKVVSPNETVSNDAPATSTPSSRPRRSCASKARYDYDLEESPTKNQPKLSKQQKAIVESDENSQDLVEVICLDVSNDNAESNNSSKLAPLFVKTVPKPAVDPEILKARQNFLMSGIPDKMRMEMAKQKQFEESYEISLETMFPRISHVGQDPIENGDTVGCEVDWAKCGIAWQNCQDSPDGKMKSRQTDMNPITPQKRPLPPLKKLADLDDKVGFVKSLKPMFDKFPTYRCYKQLRDKYKQQKAIGVEQVSDSFVIMNTRKRASSTSALDDRVGNGEILFTEKYKPMNFHQVLVNFHPVNELKNFLSSWQNGNGTKLNDSMSDFECSSDSILAGNCNSVVLHGPSSSGKTNAVFALANEMNFNVLEINAGMKRTGKKILQDLQEATQSHQVGKDKGGLLKKSFNGLKSKFNELNDSSSSTDLTGSAKLSLILVEDADVVFEQDSGFIEAIYQLVAVSKRPVIIVSNNSECQHLLRLQKQSAIEFAMPNVLNISKFLSVMSLVENCPIELDDIISLYLFNKRNLRKTLLEMQFFIQSGGDRYRTNAGIKANLLSPVRKFSVEDRQNSSDEDERTDDKCDKLRNMKSTKVYTHQTLFEFYTINQNALFSVQFPVDFDCLSFNLKTIMKRFENAQDEVSKRGRGISKKSERSEIPADGLDNLVKFYDNISAASYLTAKHAEDRLCENLQETIAHILTEQAIRINLNASGKMDNIPRTLPERTTLSPFLPGNNVRTNRSIDLDYEPMLRAICRSERSRSTIERRGSRFYHYLRNICMSTSSFSTSEFDKTCSVFASTTTSDADNDVHCD